MSSLGLKDAIRQSYLMQGLSDAELESVYAIATIKTFESGEAIVTQFDEETDLHILASGAANVVAVVGETIGLVKPGMPIGEVSFLDNGPRSVSVISDGASSTVFLPGEDMRAVLRDNPVVESRFLWNMGQVLCRRLRNANKNVEALLAVEEAR